MGIVAQKTTVLFSVGKNLTAGHSFNTEQVIVQRKTRLAHLANIAALVAHVAVHIFAEFLDFGLASVFADFAAETRSAFIRTFVANGATVDLTGVA